MTDSTAAAAGTPVEHRAWHYTGDGWAEGPDPVSEAWAAQGWKGDEADILRGLGYEREYEVGNRSDTGFTVWRRPAGDPPRNVIATGMDEMGEFFYVDSSPALREVCARWAALARDCAITALIEEAVVHERWREPYDEGVVETIARRAAEGARQPYSGRARQGTR